MACRTIHYDGRRAIACGPRIRRPPPRRCVVCGVPESMASIKLCDGPGLRPGKTCDRVMCVEHSVHIEPDTDYCPQHATPLPA